MKMITLHALGTFNLKNKEYALTDENLTLKDFLTIYLPKKQKGIEIFFSKGDNSVNYIIFVNGVIIRDEEYLLQNGDRILITPMMGGG